MTCRRLRDGLPLLPFLGYIVNDVGVPLLLPLTILTLHDPVGLG